MPTFCFSFLSSTTRLRTIKAGQKRGNIEQHVQENTKYRRSGWIQVEGLWAQSFQSYRPRDWCQWKVISRGSLLSWKAFGTQISFGFSCFCDNVVDFVYCIKRVRNFTRQLVQSVAFQSTCRKRLLYGNMETRRACENRFIKFSFDLHTFAAVICALEISGCSVQSGANHGDSWATSFREGLGETQIQGQSVEIRRFGPFLAFISDPPLPGGKTWTNCKCPIYVYIYISYVWSPIYTVYKQYLFCIYHYPFLPSRLVHLRCPIRLSYWVVPQGVGELFQVKLAKTKMELAAVEMEVPGWLWPLW